MLLLYPKRHPKTKSRKHIYIPLCFYFIFWLVRQYGYFYIIYIPLCFYFIYSNSSFVIGLSPFTFHYASTLSNFLTFSDNWYKLFTFHYASTLSSPLSLFFRNSAVFTFHYASTLSHDCWWARMDSCNLHSTMLLLYPNFSKNHLTASSFTFHYASTLSRQLLTCLRLSSIYIPLCFYFIVWPGCCGKWTV